jgi:Fe-S-cluster formation regulator IscX/YfhJ
MVFSLSLDPRYLYFTDLPSKIIAWRFIKFAEVLRNLREDFHDSRGRE